MSVRPIVLLSLFLLLLLPCGRALAHGGMHPTPWPTPPSPGPPPDTPTPPPTTPTPTPPPPPPPPPEPNPEPTPEPDPDDPEDDPKTTPNPRENDPRWTNSAKAIEKSTWKKWWEMNKWRFTWMPQRAATTTGEGETAAQRLSDFLSRQLDHSYFDVRSAAAIGLGKARAKGAAPNLRKLAQDPSPMVKESALLALGMVGDAQSAPFLLETLRSRKKANRYRVYAAVALGLLGDRAAVRSLEDLVTRTNEDDEVKAACMLALSLIKSERAGPLFVAQIGAERVKRHVKAMAATALGKLGLVQLPYGRRTVDVIRFLVGVLQTRKRDDQLRRSAALALAALGPVAATDHKRLIRALSMALNDRDPDVRHFTLMAIAEIARAGKAEVTARAVIRNVLGREKSQATKGFACLAAGLSRDRQAMPLLRHILTNGKSPDLRAAAAVGLGLLKDVGSTRALLEIIGRKGETILRGYCCTALGIMGSEENKEALPALRTILTDEADPELRAAAALALAKLGQRDALDILLKALDDRNQYFRLSAVIAVGSFRDLRAVDPLIKLYGSQGVNDELKAIICVALGSIAETSDVPRLRTISRHYNFMMIRFRILKQLVALL